MDPSGRSQQLQVDTRSRASLISAFTILVISRSRCREPPRQGLRATRALPSSVTGPVDLVHGFHRLIASLCRLRRSDVHPFMVCLQ